MGRPVVRVPRAVALTYIALCAAAAARERGGDLATEEDRYLDPVFYSREVLRADVAREVLRTYLPSDIDSIEIARIVDREGPAAEGTRFSTLGILRLMRRVEGAGWAPVRVLGGSIPRHNAAKLALSK